mmetsp:Transcript_11588/g.32144  ORF Transcript_11588/g.32144 Transcript_11588/m.32144 type:complete len:284 (-) Transcript_11588:188-1039(-)
MSHDLGTALEDVSPDLGFASANGPLEVVPAHCALDRSLDAAANAVRTRPGNVLARVEDAWVEVLKLPPEGSRGPHQVQASPRHVGAKLELGLPEAPLERVAIDQSFQPGGDAAGRAVSSEVRDVPARLEDVGVPAAQELTAGQLGVLVDHLLELAPEGRELVGELVSGADLLVDPVLELCLPNFILQRILVHHALQSGRDSLGRDLLPVLGELRLIVPAVTDEVIRDHCIGVRAGGFGGHPEEEHHSENNRLDVLRHASGFGTQHDHLARSVFAVVVVCGDNL